MTFLWVLVVLMALALAAEILALVGIALLAAGATRRVAATQKELAAKFHPAIRTIQELQIGIAPRLEAIQNDSKEIASMLSNRARVIQAVGQDTQRRAQRLQLRMNNNGIQTVEQLRQGKRAVRGGILPPIETIRGVLRGVSIAFWILRKVA